MIPRRRRPAKTSSSGGDAWVDASTIGRPTWPPATVCVEELATGRACGVDCLLPTLPVADRYSVWSDEPVATEPPPGDGPTKGLLLPARTRFSRRNK